jgi:hypothetical protein
VCGSASERQEFRDADEIVGDEVEQEVAADAAKTSMSVLRIVPCSLPQPKMHSIIARRDCDAT